MRALAPKFLAAATALITLSPAWAQAPVAPPPPQPPAVESPPATEPGPPPPPLPPTPMMPVAPAKVEGGPTDHDQVVGHWGIEARQVGVFQRSAGNDPSCGADCPLRLNAFSVRRWHRPTYAWSAGLVLGLGSGSRHDMGVTKSWDTYFGIGPVVGASFLLSNWRHLAVSFSPQLDFVFFLPRASGSKTYVLNLRALLEGELHLGFIGLPALSIGLASGLVVGYRGVSKPELNPGGLASQWDIGFSGPTSLWGLVTNMFVRFYL